MLSLSRARARARSRSLSLQWNFFVLPRRLMLADLPGYGFAFANPHKKEAWKLLMDQVYIYTQKLNPKPYTLKPHTKEAWKLLMDQVYI
jgi:hypothetical protein